MTMYRRRCDSSPKIQQIFFSAFVLSLQVAEIAVGNG